jgi:hypothetical protein
MTKPNNNQIPSNIKNVPSMTRNPMVDMFLTYQFLKRINTPFKEWDAYKLGIIDKNGKVLKKKKDLKDDNERAAWGYFDILTTNLKKLLAKVPAGDSMIASNIASYLMMKESKSEALLNEVYFEVKFMQLYEEISGLNSGDALPTNNMGSGDVDGFDPILIKKPRVLRRKKPNVVT